MSGRIIHGDCLEIMPTLATASVDLIVADPPFYKVKADEWDRQWPTPAAFIGWLGRVADEWRRLLKPNASLYCFASVEMSARVETMLAERFMVLNAIRWAKPAHSTKAEMFVKEDLRCFFPASEAIVFCEQSNGDLIASGEAGYSTACGSLHCQVFGRSIGDYLRHEMSRAGVTQGAVAALFPSRNGQKTGCVSNWLLGYNCPTAVQYDAIRSLLNASGGDYLRREYEDLRREYEDLRRPFALTAADAYTDTWTFPTVQAYAGKHPCEKPQAMLQHMIRTSSRPGALVLDSFAGSGATGRAALALGRGFVGIERDEHWAGYAEAALRKPHKRVETAPKVEAQSTLFALEANQ